MTTSQYVGLTTSDQVRLSARFWPRPGGGPSPLAYVVAHGFTGHSGRPPVRRICARLAGRGADVLCPDMRGHGRSGGRSTVGDVEIRDVAAAVAWLRARGNRRVVIAGWSMGGSIVLRHAGLGGDADAVVAVSSPGLWFERGTRAMRIVGWVCDTRPGKVAVLLGRATRLERGGWVVTPESPAEAAPGIAPRPLLIVHGDADHYFPQRHPDALGAAAPWAQVWIEPGMGHAEGQTSPALVDRIDGWARDALSVQTGLPR